MVRPEVDVKGRFRRLEKKCEMALNFSNEASYGDNMSE